jgi:type I restriction-modification system DNA methylase subunit
VHRVSSRDDHFEHIVNAYKRFKDEPGFARVATLEEIRAKDGSLSIPFYVELLTVSGPYEVKQNGSLAATGSPEAFDFTSHRLAAGSQMLLDLWYTAGERDFSAIVHQARQRFLTSSRLCIAASYYAWDTIRRLGNCPSALSADLDNLAPRRPLPGTRPGRVREVHASTHCENDPGTPKPRLPGPSNSQSGVSARIFDPGS